jgi:GNAT superfamily N-acetyltransferase
VIRRAARADDDAVRELWLELMREQPPPHHQPGDVSEFEETLREGAVFVAEENGELIGFVAADAKDGWAILTDLYVRSAARRAGVARELVRELAAELRAHGAQSIELEVNYDNADARAVYERWGFEPTMLVLAADAEQLELRVRGGAPTGRTFGSVHVQTDDRAVVERSVAKVLPRLGRSAGTEVAEPRNGWTAVYDELCDREPKLLQRLARELSYATGAPTLAIGIEEGTVVRYALYDRGGAVDEYLSIPEHYGPLPPGDVIALGANPTVVARLTGADPARVKAVARTAASPAELPPAEELLRTIAETMGIEGAERGWAE